MPSIHIRPAVPEDVAQILAFVHELAIYEKSEHEVVATEESIARSIFAPQATAHALICERDGQAIGFAVYFYNYSTWLAKNGLFLEDLYVTPEARGTGAGKALLKHLAQIAVERDCGRFEWNVLDWNEQAIRFYESIDAKPQSEWIGYRLSGQALHDLAAS